MPPHQPAYTNDGRYIDWTPNVTGQPAPGYDVHFTQLTAEEIPRPRAAAAPALALEPDNTPTRDAAPADTWAYTQAMATPEQPQGGATVTKFSTSRYDNHPTIHVEAGIRVSDAVRIYRERSGTTLEANVTAVLDGGFGLSSDYVLQEGDHIVIQPNMKTNS